MKRFLAFLAASILLFAFCGCSDFAFKTAYTNEKSDTDSKIINFSEAEFLYQILTTYSNLCAFTDSYEDYYDTGFDKSVSPDEQKYTADDSDSNLYDTWFDYIADTAYCAIQERKVLCKYAKSEGFELSDEDREKVNLLVEELKTEFTASTVSDDTDFNDYLQITYGDEMTLELFTSIQEEALLAENYEKSKIDEFYNSYPDKDIKGYYEKNIADYGAADVAVCTLKYTSENKSSIKKNAEQIFDGFTDRISVEETEQVKIIKMANAADLYELDPTGNLKNWTFDSLRQDGDKEIIETNDNIFIVYMLQKSYDIYAYNSRHILFTVENSDWDSVLKEAEKVLEIFESGSGSEESFAKLAKEYSDDTGSLENGGLYENTLPGEFVAEYEEWCLDPARKQGDVTIVKHDDPNNYQGYHIIYFKSLNEKPSWSDKIRTEKANTDYEKYSLGIFEKECKKYVLENEKFDACLEDALLRIKLIIEKSANSK